MRTGKNQIAETTDPGSEPELDPSEPDEAPRAGTDVEGDGISEHTAQTLMAPEPLPRRTPDELLKTLEKNPKTPIEQHPKSLIEPTTPTEQNPKTPIPTMDRRAEPEAPARVVHISISTAPSSLPPPKQLDPQPSGPSPACPQCEAPMSWVDEHLRFYCRQCRMYF